MARPEKPDAGKGNVEWTREQLIKAAARQFALQGYEGATLRKIREDVGVENSTIHYHFGSKQGLYTAVTDHLMQSLITFTKGLDRHRQLLPMERFLLFMENLQQWGNKEQDFTAIIFHEMMSKKLLSSDSPFYQAIGGIFNDFIVFLKGEDSQDIWREVDWRIFIVNLIFSILMGQAVSIAIPLAFEMEEGVYQQKQLDDIILTQILSLSKDSTMAISFLEQHRSSCLSV